MDYREFDVPPSLRRHVACVWRLRDDAPDTRAQTIYPDGCCELIVHRGPPMRAFDAGRGWHTQAAALFAAQQRGAIRLAAQETVRCVGVRLQPAASALIAGTSLAGLRDRIVDLGELDAAFAAAFSSAAARFDDDPHDAALWTLLAARAETFRIDARIATAVDALRSGGGRNRVQPLAAMAGMGQRSFQMRFPDVVGLGAKEFARVLRLQATLRLLDAGDASLAQVAIDGGFADQAHATRELGHFTGSTPSHLLAALRDERDGDDTIRLALAFVRGQVRARIARVVASPEPQPSESR